MGKMGQEESQPDPPENAKTRLRQFKKSFEYLPRKEASWNTGQIMAPSCTIQNSPLRSRQTRGTLRREVMDAFREGKISRVILQDGLRRHSLWLTI